MLQTAISGYFTNNYEYLISHMITTSQFTTS